MASIHSLFDEITNEDAFAQPKQVPTLHEWSTGLLQDFNDITSSFRRDSPQAKNPYSEQQLALAAQIPRQITTLGSFAMDHDWVDTPFGFTSSTFDGPSYRHSFQAQTFASHLLPNSQHPQLNNIPRAFTSAVEPAQTATDAREEVHHPLAVALRSSTTHQRPANVSTNPHIPVPRPQVSPISPIDYMTTPTSGVTPTLASAIITSAMQSPTPAPISLECAHRPQSIPLTSTPLSTPTKGTKKSYDDPDNIAIWGLRRTHMDWDDIIAAMTARDDEKGMTRDWTLAAVWGRWKRNAVQIHAKYFKDDKGFNYEKLKYQKKKPGGGSGGKKRKRAKEEEEEEEEEHEQGEGEQVDEDEAMLAHHGDHQESTTTAADRLPGQSDRSGAQQGLTIPIDDLVALHLFGQQARDALKPEVWKLMAQKMNERAASGEDENSSNKKRWSAADCEAVMEAKDE